MPLSRAVLERQLKLAEHSLQERVQCLTKAGKSADDCAQDPLWRSANANCTSIRRRLNAVAATEAINAEVERRKLQPEPEPEPKPKKEKAKAAPAPAAEGEKKPKKPKAEKAAK